MCCAIVKRLACQAQHSQHRYGREQLSFKKKMQDNRPRRQKRDKKEMANRKKNKADTKRGIEKRELLVQNLQKVGMLFILTGPCFPLGE